MGNTARVIVVAEREDELEHLMSVAQVRLAQLEARWSRFISTSEVSLLNTALHSVWTPISDDTALLLHYLVNAFRVTNGAFNPFLLPALVNAGYTHSLSSNNAAAVSLPTSSTWHATADDLELQHTSNGWQARLLNGATVDPGGIGKGLAADIIAEQLMSLNARGVSVSVGGDLRCIGSPSDAEVWPVNIEDAEQPLHIAASVLIPSGGVATSSTHAKRWHMGTLMQHHVIDPSTGQPTSPNAPDALHTATVIASSAAWAEVFATALLVSGEKIGTELLASYNLASRAVHTNGSSVENTNWAQYVATTLSSRKKQTI
jgi:thiamine biosynthesis lipoprotein